MSQLMLNSVKFVSLSHQNKLILWQQLRNIKRQWVTKFREPHYIRKRMLAACEPIMMPDKRMDSERCEKLTPLPAHEMHPYDKLLAEDFKREWESSRMIAFFHRNSMTQREKIGTRNTFQHEDMFLRFYNNKTVRYALEGSAYECALHLFQLECAILFCSEPNVSKLLKLCKKTSQINLMCAIVDDIFMNYNDLQKYSRLPSLPLLHAQLSHTLSLAGVSITNNISYPLTQLSMNLSRYVKSKSSNDSNESN